jgi:hypothetical protein
MRTIWMTFRAEARARHRAWVALALVFGVGAGSAVATFAGARRTGTAYPRFVEAEDGFDAISGGGGLRRFAQRYEALKKHPLVEDYAELVIVGAEIGFRAKTGGQRVVGFPELLIATDPAGRAMYEINRAKILDGRLPKRARTDEVAVPFTVADRYGLEVGDRLTLGVGFNLEEAGAGGFPPPIDRFPARVVGIVASPGDFEAIGQATFPVVYSTPAVYERYRELLPRPGGDRPIDELAPDTRSLGFRIRGGSDRAVAFKQAVERDLELDVPIIEPVVRRGVQKTIRLYVVALWLLGALVAIATLAIVGQTLARQQALDAADYPTLRAMGVSRRQLLGVGMLRATAIACFAAVVAAIIAYLASPLMPIGPARIAEPSPGLSFDPAAIGSGSALILLLVPLIALLPSLRAARSAALPDRAREMRPSAIVQAFARLSGSATAGTGLRMALEPGRGRTAVPVRSTILAVALGVAAVTASVTVGHSLTHLVATPALTGFTYDAILPGDDPNATLTNQQRVAKLRALPFVDKVTLGTAVNVVFGGEESFLLAFSEEGKIGYSIIEGRPPTDTTSKGLPEIAVGPTTLRRMHLRLGGTVEFNYPSQDRSEEEMAQDAPREEPTQRATIVGVAAIPQVPWAVTDPGEGAVMTAGTVERFRLGDAASCCFVSFTPGTDLRTAATKLEEAGFETSLRTKRADMVTLERVSRLPALLSGIFALIAAAALTHIIVTAVRRRRRDLAILKTLGFVTRQVRAVIAWQVSVIAIVSLVVGIPVGVIVGRWGWHLIAAQFGAVPVALAPPLIIASLVPIALVLGNAVAALPGRAAARTRPALVLRSE